MPSYGVGPFRDDICLRVLERFLTYRIVILYLGFPAMNNNSSMEFVAFQQLSQNNAGDTEKE